MELQVILGNQLFRPKYFDRSRPIYMCEDYGLCTHFKYHKHKIILFLAGMRNFRDELEAKGFDIRYFPIQKEKKEVFFINLDKTIKKQKITTLIVYEIEDKFFEKKVTDFCQDRKLKLKIRKSPMFLVSREEFSQYNSKSKKPFMKTFYEGLRKSTGILMTEDLTPVGGKFSFDESNRKKVPKKYQVIENQFKASTDPNTIQVKELVKELFPDHPGCADDFWACTTRKDVEKHFKVFLDQRFQLFGDFEDAIDLRDPFLYHSVLSPYINMGLITPETIVKKALQKEVPINCKEGLIRQIIGWREFIRGIYQEYSEVQEQSNFFGHNRKLNEKWYQGNTGVAPLDDAIKKTIRYGYCHHIERLMIISNLMLLCEIHPKEVYRWFMEMFVDSSDWVMGPNVFGMAQFSDGGIFATKPYIAGSNYIRKMSHYPKGPWCEIFDGLYWRFISKNREFFKKNYRMSMMVKLLEKMDPDRFNAINNLAEDFLDSVTES